MCSLCRLPEAKNHNYGKFLIFGGLWYWPPSTDDGQICCDRAHQRCTLTGQISSECVCCVGFRWPKTIILVKFWYFGGSVPTPFYRRVPHLVSKSRPKVYTYRPNFIWLYSLCRLPVAKNHNFRQILTFLGAAVPTPFYRWGPNFMSYSRPTVYVYTRNFISIGLFCRPVAAKNPNFCSFWTSAFSRVAIWQQSEKVEHGCTTTNLPLSNGIKIASVLQRLHSKIGLTIWRSKAWRTDKQTDKKTSHDC